MRPVKSIALVLLLVVCAATQVGCGSDAQSKPAEQEDEETAVPVEAGIVAVGMIDAVFSGTASLEADEEAAVVARAGGVVKDIFVEEGDRVRAGAPLAQLDDERLALELRRVEVLLDKLEREFERKKGLFDKQLISTVEYEQARSEHLLQEQIRDLAQLDLEFTTIRAPIDGTISRRDVKVGNMVQENEVAFHITDFDPLLAIMHVPERELQILNIGQKTALLIDALPGVRFEGFVKRISPTIDPATGTFKVTIEVQDRSSRLKPGMFGRVLVTHDTRENTLLVPKSAVVREDDQASVFVVRDSVAIRLPVVVGYENESSIEVVSGLTEGEHIITTGQGGLQDSSRVEVINN